MTDPRARRPVPDRTEPDRGIMGVFGHNTWWNTNDFSHPLGPGFEAADHTPPPIDPQDKELLEASDLIDRYNAQSARDRADEDDGILGSIAGLYAGANGGDLTALVASLTRSYTDVATKWADAARTLADNLGQMRAPQTATTGASGLGASGPVMSLRCAKPVEARVEMFRPALTLRAQPLGSDDPAIAARITDVKVEDGRLKLNVPADQPPGVYYGLLLEDAAGPAGIVTVHVFESEEA